MVFQKGYIMSEEHRKNLINNQKGMLGKHHSKEAKENIRLGNIGKKRNERTKIKLSEARLKGLAEGRIIIWNKGKPSILKGRKLKHHSLESIKRVVEKRKQNGKYVAWNKGLTKEDERVKKNIINLIKSRKDLILPIKDTSIEVKIQNFLKELQIEFLTHQHMHIEHGYQCDIFIPSINLVIECDGDYWHGNPLRNRELNEKQKVQRLKDDLRTKELQEKGYKVIRLWEHEIRIMNLNKFKEIIR